MGPRPAPPIPPQLPPSPPAPSVPPAPPTAKPSQRTPTPTQPRNQKRKWKAAHTLEPLAAALADEAWSDTSISQVDGAVDTPLERPGRTVEVEGRLEEEEVSMMGWSQVRRKKGQVETDVVARSRGREEYQTEKGQVETDVVAGSRGWEEYRRKFPHLAYEQRRGWSEYEVVKKWLVGGDEKRLEVEEECSKPGAGTSFGTP